MNERDKARPVSGEIMTGSLFAAHAQGEPTARQDFSDAEFETVSGIADSRQPSFPDAKPATGMDSLKQPVEPPPPPARGQHGGPLFWGMGLLLIALAFWVSGGHALVSQAAVVAPSGKIESLQIGEVKSRIERHNGRDILFVDGSARNHGLGPLLLPPIEIAVTGHDGSNTRYHISTNGSELKSGERYMFSSRLEAPSAGVKTVSVTFQESIR